MQVFWKQGFAATSMSDIYAATGLKPSSVSFYDPVQLIRHHKTGDPTDALQINGGDTCDTGFVTTFIVGPALPECVTPSNCGTIKVHVQGQRFSDVCDDARVTDIATLDKVCM